MKRIIIGGVLGGVVIFIWGILAWTVLDLHMPTLHGLPDEAAVTEALKKQDLKTGVYLAPWSSDEKDRGNSESDWTQRHQAGPIYSIYFHKEGAAPMGRV